MSKQEESNPTVYGVYKCGVRTVQGNRVLTDVRPLLLETESQKGEIKTVSIYPHEREYMNHGVGKNVPAFKQAERSGIVYLTEAEYKEIADPKPKQARKSTKGE